MLKGVEGSPSYRAPEMLTQPGYTTAVDMWALGVVLYEALTGKHPFIEKYQAQTENNILEKEIDISDKKFARLSPQAKEFLLACLQKNPANRLTVDTALKHPWLQMLKTCMMFQSGKFKRKLTLIVEARYQKQCRSAVCKKWVSRGPFSSTIKISSFDYN